MNKAFLSLLIVAFCSMLAFAQDAAPADAKTKAILKLLEDWDNAYIKKDATPLLKLLSDDFIGIDENGEVTHKTDEISLITTGEYVIHSVKYLEPPVIRIYGATAIATTYATVNQTYKGQPGEFKGRSTTVCVEKEGRWVAVSWHGSKLSEK
jgi:ketosteroid isomerase-like protein